MKSGTKGAKFKKRFGAIGPGTNEGFFAAWFQAPSVKNHELG